MLKQLGSAALVAILSIASVTAQAKVVYNVSSTSKKNCADSPHGLWTSSDIGGGACSNYFDIGAGSTFTLYNDDADSSKWSAVLDATATNPFGAIADIQLTFTDFSETSTLYKKEGGGSYDPGTDSPDVDFFGAVSGKIEIDAVSYIIDGFVTDTLFQFGLGANAKVPTEFGASSWIVSSDILSHHWDLNLQFEEVSEAPLTGMLIMGLSLMLAARSRKA